MLKADIECAHRDPIPSGTVNQRCKLMKESKPAAGKKSTAKTTAKTTPKTTAKTTAAKTTTKTTAKTTGKSAATSTASKAKKTK